MKWAGIWKVRNLLLNKNLIWKILPINHSPSWLITYADFISFCLGCLETFFPSQWYNDVFVKYLFNFSEYVWDVFCVGNLYFLQAKKDSPTDSAGALWSAENDTERKDAAEEAPGGRWESQETEVSCHFLGYPAVGRFPGLQRSLLKSKTKTRNQNAHTHYTRVSLFIHSFSRKMVIEP